jgi:hypothetical protein
MFANQSKEMPVVFIIKMSSLRFVKDKKPGCFELDMRNGVNCLSTLIRSVVRCLNVVFSCFVKKNNSECFVSGLYLSPYSQSGFKLRILPFLVGLSIFANFTSPDIIDELYVSGLYLLPFYYHFLRCHFTRKKNRGILSQGYT